MSCGGIEVASPVMVDAYIQRWTITNDDIYLLKFQEAPPQWMEDMFNNMLDDTGLPNDVDDLNTRFTNFEEGYTEHFYDWKDGDTETLAYVSNLYTTNAVFNAGIQEIKIAYVSKNESGALFDTLIGAWQTGAGGAWFNEQVSVISNVAYSAARSASTLTATLSSQADDITYLAGSVEDLEKQIDGVVETFFDTHDVVTALGELIPTAEPYATWLTEGTRDLHTGDTYVKYELDVNGNQVYIGSFRFTKTAINEPVTDADGYAFIAVTDSRAEEAYQLALDAQITADGKVNTFYQDYPPTIGEYPTLGEGDLWFDSGNNNILKRYNGTEWILVRDTDITASVNRLDEATVLIDGSARAKSSLVVDADGVTSGYVAEADNSTWSTFNIFADKFYVSGAEGSGFSQAPFSIDTVKNLIKFNGLVEFTNVLGSDDVLITGQAASDINAHTTTIDGGKITVDTINANRLAVNTLWARGIIASEEQALNNTGYIPNVDPLGFLINGNLDKGSFNYPNIYGGYIRGGTIYGTKMEAVSIKTSELILTTSAGLNTSLVVIAKEVNNVWDLYPYNSTLGGTSGKQRIGEISGNSMTVPTGVTTVLSNTWSTTSGTPSWSSWKVRVKVGTSILETVNFSSSGYASVKGMGFNCINIYSTGFYPTNIYTITMNPTATLGTLYGSGAISVEIYSYGYLTTALTWKQINHPQVIVYNK